MGSEFSALDAELASLGEGPTVDVLQLARAYAGTLGSSDEAPGALELSAVDDALSELEAARGELVAKRQSERAERAERVRRSTIPPPLPSRRPPAATRAPESEEILLPEPVEDELPRMEPGPGELPTSASAAGNGALAREHTGKRLGHDDTLEPFDDELEESDAHLIEFSPAAKSHAPSGAPPDTIVEREGGPLFDLHAKRDDAAQLEADAAFAELFSEAAQSDLASSAGLDAPEQYGDDTETFDSSSLGLIEDRAAAAHTVSDEELDSAEFEIVMEAEQDRAPSVPPQRAEPEKRPSFLGRLFGRKED